MAQTFRSGHVTELGFYTEQDADILASWYYDQAYRFFFRHFGEMLEMDGIRQLGRHLLAGGTHLLVIREKSTQNPIGLMTFILEKASAKVYKFGIMLHESFQRKTYAIDAIVILGDYLCRVKKAHKIVVEFSDQDAQIHRITQKGGFTHEATLKDEIFVDGKYFDEARYYLMDETFFELYGEFLPVGE